MTIAFDATTRTFHLRSGACSYILQVDEDGYLVHRYFGPALADLIPSLPTARFGRAFGPTPNPDRPQLSLDTLPQEYPTYGRSDFRVPALEARFENGTSAFDLRYDSHRMIQGKPALTGLPATYAEHEQDADTLTVVMVDAVSGLTVELMYTAYTGHNVIARSARIRNNGASPIQLVRALSISLDLPDSDYSMTQLSGAWGRERHAVTRKLVPGDQSIDSRRGASSHQQNPFLALARSDASETHGDVLGVNLVYSGNFALGVEVDQFHTARLYGGVNPFDFSWWLEPGESFQAPEAILAHSSHGFGELSRTLHRFYRMHLVPARYRDAERPVLINNWEATYFGFNADILADLGRIAGGLGIELFVLDDGWFGHRDDDHTSLGDWVVDRRKLPNGLEAVADSMLQSGMQFGLWFEPEMVSVDSNLYRTHPDWCLHVPDRTRTEGRNQLILDYSRTEVCQAVIEQLSQVLSSAPIRYVKWDMNRHMTEIGSATLEPKRQRETAHRYMLGLYSVLDTLTTNFPQVLFEGCSGGGGRFDPGILYYMPQIWTSDDTDAIARLPIQFGTSLAYPASTMSAHVSAVPNHQVHRMTSLFTRGVVAMMGNFGYELDLRSLTQEELDEIREQVVFYKSIRPLLMTGNLYRLIDPLYNNGAAWMYVNDTRTEALVSCVQVLEIPGPVLRWVKLEGLDPTWLYSVELIQDTFRMPVPEEKVWTVRGDELQHMGLFVPLVGDFAACCWRVRVAK